MARRLSTSSVSTASRRGQTVWPAPTPRPDQPSKAPATRGADSPTLVVEPGEDGTGLFAVFDQVFESLWERSKPR